MAKLVVFDFDGTLSDSRTSIIKTFQHACIELGTLVPQPEDIATRIGLPLVQMFEELVPDGPNAALVLGYREAYVAIDRLHTTLFPGVHSLLGHLPGLLAIATSKSQSGAEASVGRSGLTPHFDLIVGHDTVARPKPNPDMLEYICAALDVAPSEAVMVGDTTFDLEMADNAGMRAIGVAWGMHGSARLSRWEVVDSMGALRASLA